MLGDLYLSNVLLQQVIMIRKVDLYAASDEHSVL